MPQTINGFQVLRKVAESNTAEIFHVLRLVGRGRGTEAAMKALRPEFADDRTERGYLDNEYRICSTLDHKNIIKIYEAQLSNNPPFLVMDLILGPSLKQMLDKERPNLAAALDWIAQVADGLGYCHEHGYVHRDVKPQNMVIGDDGRPVMIDFALSTPTDNSAIGYLIRKLKQRRRPGTWSYMSPEQIRQQRVTAQSDVYGLGVTLFEVVTGRLPYTGDSPQELLEKHVNAPVPSVLILREEVPLDLDEFIRTMMAKDPLDRPLGMGYVSSKLRALIPACRRIS